MTTISESTPIAMLTVGQLREALGISNEEQPPKIQSNEQPRQYVFGISGIRKLFGISHVTACKYKSTVIRDAVSQRGRVIITDADKAMQLFKEWKEGVK